MQAERPLVVVRHHLDEEILRDVPAGEDARRDGRARAELVLLDERAQELCIFAGDGLEPDELVVAARR